MYLKETCKVSGLPAFRARSTRAGLKCVAQIAAVSFLSLSLSRRAHDVSANYDLSRERKRHRRTG